MSAVRVRPVGAHALLLEVDDPAGWYADLSRRRAAGELSALDIVPAARTVLLDGVPDVEAVSARVRDWTPAPAEGEQDSAKIIEIPVDFAGPDLAAVAELWATDEAGVVGRLTTTELTVAFCGFTPGWAYLAGLPADLAVPRLATPRTRVPAGSVALADGYAGIYPTASPGGWRLVGRTDITLFDPDREPPALLTPGTRVAFRVRSSP